MTPPAAFTLAGLQARAADYYAQIRTPRESWRTLDDVRPQLAEFELRCDTGDYDTAATVLDDIDFDYLRVWGHYRTLIDLHGRIHGRITDPALNAAHLSSLGLCRSMLGEYRAGHRPAHPGAGHRPRHRRPPGRGRRAGQPGALPLQPGRVPSGPSTCTPRRWPSPATSATAGARAPALGNLGNCRFSLGEYRAGHRPVHPGAGHRPRHRRPPGRGRRAGQPGALPLQPGRVRRAIDLHTQALAIARDIGDRRGEGAWLGNLGNCRSIWASTSGPSTCTPRRWPSPATSATAGARASALGNLGNCRSSLGEYERAIDLYTQALAIARDIGDRQGEGAWLGNLGLCRSSLGEYGGPSTCAPRRWPSPATSATAGARASGWATWGTAVSSLGEYERAIDLLHPGAGHRPRHRRPPGRGRLAGQPGELPLQLGEYERAIDLLHPGAGHRPRHRRPLRRGERA